MHCKPPWFIFDFFFSFIKIGIYSTILCTVGVVVEAIDAGKMSKVANIKENLQTLFGINEDEGEKFNLSGLTVNFFVITCIRSHFQGQNLKVTLQRPNF